VDAPKLGEGETPPPGFVGYDADGNFVHYCPVCGAFGPYGVGYFPNKGELGKWFCREHRQIIQPTPQPAERPMQTPTRFVKPCEFCSKDLDTRESGVHQFTTGWVKQREGGGGHGISLAKREDRWAHGYCIDNETKGYTGQGNMF